MSRVRAMVFGVFVFGAALALGSQIVFPGLSGSVANAGNVISAGTVSLSDNDAGVAMFTLSNATPPATTTKCIAVQHSGTLNASVKLYGTVTGSLAPYLQLKVERGTAPSSFPSCTGFVVDATNYLGLGPGVLYSGALSAYPVSAVAGIADPNASWTNGYSRGYRLTVTLNNNPAAQGLSAAAIFTWQAANT